jgi:glycine oxidase
MSDTAIIPDQGAERIVVVGAGAAGLACAWRLAGAGFQVTVVEAGEPGQGALTASGGMLAAGYESVIELEADHALASAFVRFAKAAADLWPAWAERLQRESGRALGYERRGALTPIFTADQSERAAAAMERARELEVEAGRLDADAVGEAEPALARTLGAVVFPKDGQVDNRALGQALAEAAEARGAQILRGRRVTGLDRAGGRVSGVTLDLGDPLTASAVILATGAGAAPGEPASMAMEPVKGQMIAFAAARPLAPSHIIRGFDIYLAAKPNMRLVAGATSEPGRDDEETDDASVARLTEAARAAIPGLKAVPVMERWAGVRPRTADSMPVIGEIEPGLFGAGGGYRNGVLLAPAIAEALAARLSAGEAWSSAAPFSPDRPGLTGPQR